MSEKRERREEKLERKTSKWPPWKTLKVKENLPNPTFLSTSCFPVNQNKYLLIRKIFSKYILSFDLYHDHKFSLTLFRLNYPKGPTVEFLSHHVNYGSINIEFYSS